MNAQDYKKLASAKRAEAVVFDVIVPSGGIWKLKEPPMQQWVFAGKIPSSLAAKMANAGRSATPDSETAAKDFALSLTVEELMDSLAFGRDLLLHCAVEPEVSLDPQTDNQILPEDILPEDFTFLINWLMSGGKSGESLSTFRPE